jgi:hypothetical protein
MSGGLPNLSRRDEWRKVLDAEVERWSAKSYEEIIFALRDHQAYEVEVDAQKYRVEVEVLEITEKYLQVVVAVDDGSLPASVLPLSRSFFCRV